MSATPSPRGERLMVEEPRFESYYGRQIIKTPAWKTPDVPLYLFLGGMAGSSALLAEGAALPGRPHPDPARPLPIGGRTTGLPQILHPEVPPAPKLPPRNSSHNPRAA